MHIRKERRKLPYLKQSVGCKRSGDGNIHVTKQTVNSVYNCVHSPEIKQESLFYNTEPKHCKQITNTASIEPGTANVNETHTPIWWMCANLPQSSATLTTGSLVAGPLAKSRTAVPSWATAYKKWTSAHVNTIDYLWHSPASRKKQIHCGLSIAFYPGPHPQTIHTTCQSPSCVCHTVSICLKR